MAGLRGELSGEIRALSRPPRRLGDPFSRACRIHQQPEPHVGRTVAWSPDSKQIAFVSAQAGPETKDASGDPMVVTRYLYKPDYWEGNSHFNDNRRLHIFVVDLGSGKVRQLTQGTGYEHSIDWSDRKSVV